jgi:hypothetical protein
MAETSSATFLSEELEEETLESASALSKSEALTESQKQVIALLTSQY